MSCNLADRFVYNDYCVKKALLLIILFTKGSGEETDMGDGSISIIKPPKPPKPVQPTPTPGQCKYTIFNHK